MRNLFFIGFISFILLNIPSLSQGFGGISISPKRIIFEGRSRIAEVILMNRGIKKTTYRVYFNNMRMEKNGTYTVIEELGQGDRFADNLIRYSPRQVTIPPGGSQIIRLMVRKPKGLESGEYRSHLFFESIPSKEAGIDLETENLEKGVSVKIIARYAISIPIIIRHGKLDAHLTISDLEFTSSKTEEEKPRFSLTLNRHGKRSVYGSVIVNFQSVTGSSVEMGRVNGVAVFTPNESRLLDITLYPPEGINIKNGTLHVIFKEKSKNGNDIFAEEKLFIP